MGYTTNFHGSFELDRPVDDATYALLHGLATTRRMKRKLGPEYGVDGEFYVDSKEDFGQTHTPDIVNFNCPPSTQPGLWCHWLISSDRMSIEWDGGEKFYDYVEWLKYIIDNILHPRGYVLNGQVSWQGEDAEDMGIIRVDSNGVRVGLAKISFEFDV